MEEDSIIKRLLNAKTERLRSTLRYNTCSLIKEESVAEHSWYCAWYALIILHDLKINDVGMELTILKRALLHDIEECSTGDIVRPFKHYDSGLRTLIHQHSENVVTRIFDSLGMVTHLKAFWLDSKDQSLEGSIVRFADDLCVVAKMLHEVNLGNTYMRKRLVKILDSLKEYQGDPLYGRYYVDLVELIMHRITPHDKFEKTNPATKRVLGWGGRLNGICKEVN